jgi:hypothetical protein
MPPEPLKIVPADGPLPRRLATSDLLPVLDALADAAKELHISIKRGGVTVTLDVAGTAATSPGDLPDALSPCEADIITTISNAGQRLTAEGIKRGLQDAGKLHGDSTVTKALARLVQKKKCLTNRSDSYGRGYGLADWS